MSEKNRPLRGDEVHSIAANFNIDTERPIITQVGRFDPWKDPLGAIDVYRLVKKREDDLQLLLIGSFAQDDPEGESWYRKVVDYAGGDGAIHILSNRDGVGAREVNALQRASDVILQMSAREGFGLTVTEASWKGIPVVGRPVGGIAAQIIDGETGYLTDSVEEAASRVLYLLRHKDVAASMGASAKRSVSEKYLITHELKKQFEAIASTV